VYETFPLEQVAGKCFVMDLNTFCKGRPKGFEEKDIYICERRVDKNARLFNKISKK
jgi:histone-lysine N-methyltransferase ASH1L